MHRFIVEVAAQDGDTRWIRRIGNDGQAATCHGSGNQRVLEAIGQPFDQRTEIGQGGVIGERRQDGRPKEHLIAAHAHQYGLQPPLLLAAQHHQPGQEEGNQQSFAQDEAVLMASIAVVVNLVVA